MSKYYKKEEMQKFLADVISFKIWDYDEEINRDTVIKKLYEIPTIEINEGEWVSTFSGVYMCSNCKESFVNIPEDGYFRPMWSFCPKCGAKMKGVK